MPAAPGGKLSSASMVRNAVSSAEAKLAQSVDRRHLLGFVATSTAALATLAAARPAGAWQVEQLSPKSPLGAVLANRCEAASTHVGLIGQLQAQLTKEPLARSLAATCPICGCLVTVSR